MGPEFDAGRSRSGPFYVTHSMTYPIYLHNDDNSIKLRHMRKTKQKRGRYGDGCIYRQKGRRTWWIAWYERRLVNGTEQRERCYESTGSEDRAAAQRKLRAKLQLVGGRRPTETDPRKITYDTLRDNYLEFCVSNGRRSLKKDRAGNFTLNTIPRIDRFFGGWRAADIQVAHLKRFRADGKGDGLSDARLNRYMRTLSSMFHRAVKDELITSAEVPPYFPVTAEPNEAVGAIFVQRKWYDDLCRVLKEPLRSALVLAYNTGIRVEELLRLRWSAVGQSGIITLPARGTKTMRQRQIWLPRDFKLRRGQPDELVFSLGDCRIRWRTACVKVGAGHYECRECGSRCNGTKCPKHGRVNVKRLRYAGITLRHCRHTFVRNASDRGLKERRIMDITGHDTRSTFDRYNIGRERDVLAARDLMEGPGVNQC